MAALCDMVIACPHSAPPLRPRVIPREKPALRPAFTRCPAQIVAPAAPARATTRSPVTRIPVQATLSLLSPHDNTATRQATSQLQPAQQLRPSVAKNASGDTGRQATESFAKGDRLCRPVVSPAACWRRSNPLPSQPLRLLSLETREATKLPARKFAREATTPVIDPLLQWATCRRRRSGNSRKMRRQQGNLFSPFEDHQ